MSKVHSSQIELLKSNETSFSFGKDIIGVVTLFAYVALPTFLLALTWLPK